LLREPIALHASRPHVDCARRSSRPSKTRIESSSKRSPEQE
jgi:hypothetical protein